jgi:hypothetical protein
MLYKFSVTLFVLLCSFSSIIAQEESHEQHATGGHEGMKGSQRLTLGLGHTHVSEGVKDGKREWLILPSWSLNYDYWLKDNLSIGLQTDLILETFIIEDHEKELIERSRPISLVPVVIYKPFKRWAFLGGVGGEFSKEQNLALTRLGVEYGIHLPKHWEIGAALVWDNKWNYYNSWGLAITVSKIWGAKHR